MNEDNTLIYDWMPLIRLSNGSYPVYMPQVRSSNTQSSFPIPVKAFMILPFDVMPVYDSERPSGDVVTEGTPEFNEQDGKWYKTWNVRDFTEEEIAENLMMAKQDTLGTAQNTVSNDVWSGMPYSLNGVDYVVDVASEKLNLLVSVKSLAKDAQETEMFPYSFNGDIVVDLTKQEFLDMWQSVTTNLYNTYKSYWQFRDEVNAVTLIENIPEVPATFKS